MPPPYTLWHAIQTVSRACLADSYVTPRDRRNERRRAAPACPVFAASPGWSPATLRSVYASRLPLQWAPSGRVVAFWACPVPTCCFTAFRSPSWPVSWTRWRAAVVAGLVRREAVRQVLPAGTGPQHPQHAVKPVVLTGPSSGSGWRRERLDDPALRLGQFHSPSLPLSAEGVLRWALDYSANVYAALQAEFSEDLSATPAQLVAQYGADCHVATRPVAGRDFCWTAAPPNVAVCSIATNGRDFVVTVTLDASGGGATSTNGREFDSSPY